MVARSTKKASQNTEQQSVLRAQLEREAFGDTASREGQLSEPEVWWRQHFGWLKDRGYLLRQRYSPDWNPSWLGTKKNRFACEDGRAAKFASRLLDATRISDGKYVVLKLVKKSDHPFELEICQIFSSQPLADASSNHCVPIYDTLRLPDDSETVIIVMPLLVDYRYPEFDTIGETVECFRQLFEGLQFMHKHRVAHRDSTSRNFMMDPASFYIDAFHPVNPKMKRDFSGRTRFRTRTSGLPKYLLIDFGLSRRYDPSVVEPREIPIWGADKEVPEFQNSNEPCNPFPTDVFYIGNMIKKDFIESKRGFEFMQLLIADMVQQDPSKRPTMDEAVKRFHAILSDLSSWKLRSRVVDKEESLLDAVFHGTSHWVRRIRFMTGRVPAIPTPNS